MSHFENINSSMPLIGRSLPPLNHLSRSISKNNPNHSNHLSADQHFMPIVQIQKILKKIGANDRHRSMYVPNEDEQANFRKRKIEELKQQYSPKKIYKMKEQFENELDEIVLDCWRYGDNCGKKTVWKRYRQNCDELTFDTLKLIKKDKPKPAKW